MKLGRNDPCHCGSGKKYKHCHLATDEAPGPGDVTWRRLQAATEKLTPALLRFADEHFGPSGLDESWYEFNLYEDVPPFEEDDPSLPLFFPWFFYNWLPDPEETEVPEAAHSITAADAYLRTAGERLDPLARQYIDHCLDAEMSFHEILSCSPGQGFRLRDILLGTESEVIERIGSEDARPGDILYCKVVPIEDIAVLDGCGSALIPPVWKPLIVDLRRAMRNGGDAQTKPQTKPQTKLGVSHLREWDFDMRELYLHIEDQTFDPPTPGATNADGEPIEPHRLVYEIDSIETSFEALKELEAGAREAELLERIERDEAGAMMRVVIGWRAPGKPRRDDPDAGMLGTLLLHENSLIAVVNSAPRALRLTELIEARLGTSARKQELIVEPIETIWQRSGLPDPDEPLAEEWTTSEHYRNWVDAPVPALGDLSPRDAAADADGREAVAALVLELERAGAEMRPRLDPVIIADLREMLGLAA